MRAALKRQGAREGEGRSGVTTSAQHLKGKGREGAGASGTAGACNEGGFKRQGQRSGELDGAGSSNTHPGTQSMPSNGIEGDRKANRCSQSGPT